MENVPCCLRRKTNESDLQLCIQYVREMKRQKNTWELYNIIPSLMQVKNVGPCLVSLDIQVDPVRVSRTVCVSSCSYTHHILSLVYGSYQLLLILYFGHHFSWEILMWVHIELMSHKTLVYTFPSPSGLDFM